MKIERLSSSEWERLKRIRLAALQEAADGSNSDAYLISMWVSPTERGKYVGEQLVEAVVKWARDAGFSRLLLDVADNNLAAISLYEWLDFRPTGDTGVYPPPRSSITEHRRARKL